MCQSGNSDFDLYFHGVYKFHMFLTEVAMVDLYIKVEFCNVWYQGREP